MTCVYTPTYTIEGHSAGYQTNELNTARIPIEQYTAHTCWQGVAVNTRQKISIATIGTCNDQKDSKFTEILSSLSFLAVSHWRGVIIRLFARLHYFGGVRYTSLIWMLFPREICLSALYRDEMGMFEKSWNTSRFLCCCFCIPWLICWLVWSWWWMFFDCFLYTWCYLTCWYIPDIFHNNLLLAV